jgi:plastocyanin
MRTIQGSSIAALAVGAIVCARGAFGATTTVRVANVSFQPGTVSIAQGDSIKWSWVSGDHSTTSGACSGSCTPNGIWDSGVKSSGTFTRVFNAQGTFHYFCTVHGSMMQGTIIVGPPPPLTASAEAAPACGPTPLGVAFTGTATGGNAPYTFSWNYGDGSGPSSEPSPSHIYAASGEFTATLQVTDVDLDSSQDTVAIKSSDVPIATITRVRKLTGPFRLIIKGAGFAAGADACTIRIDGVDVPASKCASATKVVAKKGAALKAMLPLDQPVTITVVDNQSGVESCPFTFTRRRAASSSTGGPPNQY